MFLFSSSLYTHTPNALIYFLSYSIHSLLLVLFISSSRSSFHVMSSLFSSLLFSSFLPCLASCFIRRTTALQGRLTARSTPQGNRRSIVSLSMQSTRSLYLLFSSHFVEQLHCKSIHSSLFSSSSFPICCPAKRVTSTLFQWFRVRVLRWSR